MSMLSMKVSVEGGEAALAGVSALTLGDRMQAHQAMAQGIEKFTRAFLRGAPSRKQTAQNLGATPTGFYKKAAATVEAKGTPTGIMLTMQRAGLSRAFYPYDLKPRRAKVLTIPLAAESYGKRAGEFADLKWKRFSDEAKEAGETTHAGLVLGRLEGGLFRALFRGVRKAHQKQDRALLPDDQAWLDEAAEAALDYMEAIKS